jgi:hypothetical protein
MSRVAIQYVSNNTARELIQIDATTGEDHEFSSKATIHPVEDGSSISDHVIKNPKTLSLTGIISDHPISISSAPVENIDGIGGSAIGGASTTQSSEKSSKVGSNILSTGSGKISKIAMEIFESMREDRLLLTIITDLETYTNMVLESFKANKTARTANALPFTATFKEVKIAVSEVVEVPLTAIQSDVRDSASEKQNKGKLSTTEAEGKEAEKGSSLLFKLKEAI